MDYNKVFSMIEDLLKKAEYGQITLKEGEPHKKFGTGDITLAFQGTDNVQVFSDAIDELWGKDKDLYETYSHKTFEEKLADFLRMCKQGQEFSIETLKEFFKRLRDVPIQTFEILYFLYGAEYHRSSPLKLGPYTIFNTQIHLQHLIDKYPHSKSDLEFEYDPVRATSKVVISVCEEARETARANQKALVRLRQFENTIRFMIADSKKHYDVGVFNFNETKLTYGVLLSDDIVGSTTSLTGTLENISLNKFPINDSRYGHDKLWELLDKEKPTALEQRIMSAITWVGKGLRDEEPARTLVQYVFALEALLQFQQKDSMVSPSITYQMSELAAFIIGEDLENRLKIEKMIKRIYKKRSAIAHGGSHEVDELILEEALFLLKSLIMILTTNEELKKLKTIEQVSDWVRKQKYS